MTGTVRYPEIDYGKCSPHWAPNLEFAMQMNAFSIVPMHLEPYIVRVFLEAKKLLDPERDAQLIKEVDWFVAQEGQHHRQHRRFNELFTTARYPEVEHYSRRYAEALEDFRKNRSMLFNLSYIEGFEAAGAVFYKIWFEKLGKYRIGASEEALLLYDWHFAEEFEHREVAYKLYMAIAVRGNIFRKIWYGYFYRVYGVIKLLLHSGSDIAAIRTHMLGVERGNMNADGVKRSRAKERKLYKTIFRSVASGLLGVLSPFYNPARKSAPEGLDAVLAKFEKGGPYARIPRSSTAAG